MQGAELLTDARVEEVLERTLSTLATSVRQEDGLSNWTLCDNPDKNKMLVQWCHGAAGIVTAMARTMFTTTEQTQLLDELLKQTGELVWQAGPLAKGAGICHGAAGNGYSFLYHCLFPEKASIPGLDLF